MRRIVFVEGADTSVYATLLTQSLEATMMFLMNLASIVVGVLVSTLLVSMYLCPEVAAGRWRVLSFHSNRRPVEHESDDGAPMAAGVSA